MIEIVYDKATAEKNAKNDGHYRMPKNIRQIGNAPDKKKIYIEDYVMTFLRKIAEPGNTTSRGAILLGEYFKDGDTETLFISGAVEAQNLEFDVEQIKFDDHIWSKLYADINKYFENLSVVGWFLSRMGFSTEINDKITRLHLENFRGRDKVLFVMDSLECDDAFYVCEKNRLMRQRGYYIYYVRNEAMQSYIISRKNMSCEDKQNAAVRKDAELVKNFRAMRGDTPEKPKKNRTYVRYAVASFAALFVLSMGVAVSGNYDKMKNIESTIRKMELENGDSGVQVFSNSNTEQTIYTKDIDSTTAGTSAVTETQTESAGTDKAGVTGSNGAQNKTQVDQPDTESLITTEHTTSQDNTQENTQETMAEGILQYYTIKEGDTLMSISIKMYKSPEYVDALMNANGIKEGDTIYPGEKIAIPSVN